MESQVNKDFSSPLTRPDPSLVLVCIVEDHMTRPNPISTPSPQAVTTSNPPGRPDGPPGVPWPRHYEEMRRHHEQTWTGERREASEASSFPKKAYCIF